MTLPPFRWSPRPTTTLRRMGGSLGRIVDRSEDHPDRPAQGAGETGDGPGVRSPDPASSDGEQGAGRDAGKSSKPGEGLTSFEDQSFE